MSQIPKSKIDLREFTQSATTYPGLDGFRALAALAVFFFHAGVMSFGYLGVQAFFVLSSFLLTPTLLRVKDTPNKIRFIYCFFGRRICRIFPLYYAYVLGVALLFYFVSSDKLLSHTYTQRFFEQIWWALTFSYNFLQITPKGAYTPLLTHFWSLASEEQFYIVWPCFMLMVPRNRLKLALLTVMLAVPFYRLLLASASLSGLFDFISREHAMVAYLAPFSQLDAFAAGGYFALFGRSCSLRTLLLCWVALICLGVGLEYWFLDDFQLRNFGFKPFLNDSWKWFWAPSALSIMFGLTITSVKYSQFLPKLFEAKPLCELGKVSYGFYVYHVPVIWLVEMNLGFLSIWVRMFLELSITLLITVSSYFLFEKRALALKDRYFSYQQ